MKKLRGSNYIILSIITASALGIEVLMAYFIEPFIFGNEMKSWTVFQTIIHWVVTCIIWGVICYYVIRIARKRYDFDIFQSANKMSILQWVLVLIAVLISLYLSYLDWDGIKIVKEFYSNGLPKFIFQYIYYCFETMIVTLILVFGQKAFEEWFHKSNLPYGGILVALTWGVGHLFTKDITTGIMTIISGLAFGSIYLLTNRDIKKTYLFLWMMFVL